MRGIAKADCARGTFAAAILALPLLLAACAEAAPDLADFDRPQATYYTVIVRPGDTVSGIASRYDVSPSVVARLNRVTASDPLRAGDVVRIPAVSERTRRLVMGEASDRGAHNYARPPRSFAPYNPSAQSRDTVAVRDLSPARAVASYEDEDAPKPESKPVVVMAAHGRFAWPLSGPVISAYGRDDSGARNDGINIAAEAGTPIHAAAAGTVTYAGNELKGYGNLILIRHDDGYVTAYAHAENIAVARGDHVEKGQVIGTAGETGDVDRPQLHFEIRRGVQPVNPRLLLAAR